MNLARLRGLLARNKTTLGIAGAGAVVLLALRTRSRAGSTPAPAGTSSSEGLAAPGYPAGSSYSAGYQTAGYDSSAVDVYNTLEPIISDIRERLDERDAEPPVPVPADPWAERRDAIAGFYKTILKRDAGTSEINSWDATGGTLEQIRQGIVGSAEAKKVR